MSEEEKHALLVCSEKRAVLEKRVYELEEALRDYGCCPNCLRDYWRCECQKTLSPSEAPEKEEG